MNKNNTLVIFHAPSFPFLPPLIDINQTTAILHEYDESALPKNTYKKIIKIPRGEYDLAIELEKLAVDKFENIFLCLDATLPFVLRNLKNVAKKIYLILGDTHHMSKPITKIREYIKSEYFDGIIFTNNLRHAHWFRDVTDSNFYFEPAIFVLDSKKNHIEQNPSRLEDVIFYGQLGIFHPRRCRILPELISKKLVTHIHGSAISIATALQNTVASINITLNSDLNSRVFEIAQSGALLIIDQLSISNGHGTVLIPGHNCLTFKNSEELICLLSDINHLKIMQSICGKNLKEEFDIFWGIKNIRDRLKPNNGLINLNRAENYSTLGLNQSDDIDISKRINLYEIILELHRNVEKILVYIESPFKDIFQSDLMDLPRLDIVNNVEELNLELGMCIFIKQHNNVDNIEIFEIRN